MKIYFQKGRRAGESIDCEPPGIFIGREEDNDIQLLIDGVSQYHAKVMYGDDGWTLEDLDSSNGTRVNGKRVKAPTPLKTGDMIYIAKEALKVEFDEKIDSDKAGKILDEERDRTIKLRSPEDAKKTFPSIEEPKKPTATKTNMGGIPKKSREQRAQQREINLMVQQAIREKKKRLTIISIIIALAANGLVFWWWFSRWLDKQ